MLAFFRGFEHNLVSCTPVVQRCLALFAMHEAIHLFSTEAGWRLRTLLRTKRFYTIAKLIRLFKCHILSYIEGATAAIYHAAPSNLRPLDELLDHFLSEIGVSREEALINHC